MCAAGTGSFAGRVAADIAWAHCSFIAELSEGGASDAVSRPAQVDDPPSEHDVSQAVAHADAASKNPASRAATVSLTHIAAHYTRAATQCGSKMRGLRG